MVVVGGGGIGDRVGRVLEDGEGRQVRKLEGAFLCTEGVVDRDGGCRQPRVGHWIAGGKERRGKAVEA